MNPFEMVVLIVGIVMISNVVKARYGVTKDRHGNEDRAVQHDEAGFERVVAQRLHEVALAQARRAQQ